MNKAQKLVDVIAQRVKSKVANALVAQIEHATVKSVEADGTCTVQMLSDKEGDLTSGIQTSIAANFNIKPAINSKCQVAHIMNEDAEGLLIWCEKIDEVTINGDAFGGLVNAKELKTQLDKTNQVVQAMMTAFSAWVTVPNDGGAALKAVMSSQLAGKTLGIYNNIENKTVKHGEG